MPAFAILTDALDAAAATRARHPLHRRREQRAPRCLRGAAQPRARPPALPAGGRRRAGDADDHPGRRAGAVRRHVLGVRARPDRRGAAGAGQRRRAQGEVLPRARPPARADARHRAQGVRPPARLCGGERARGPAREARAAHGVPGRDLGRRGAGHRAPRRARRRRVHPVLVGVDQRAEGRRAHPPQPRRPTSTRSARASARARTTPACRGCRSRTTWASSAFT